MLLMRVIWLMLIAFVLGALAVFFVFNPTLLDPQNLVAAAVNFFTASQSHPPAYYMKWICGLGAITLVTLSASLGLLAWVTKLEKTISSQNESLFDLRSQLHELMKNQQKN